MDESVKKIKHGLLQHLMQLMCDDDDEKLVKIKSGKSPFGGEYSVYESQKEIAPEESSEPKDASSGQEDELDELWKRKGIKKPE
jgi:hypothetical protein